MSSERLYLHCHKSPAGHVTVWLSWRALLHLVFGRAVEGCGFTFRAGRRRA